MKKSLSIFLSVILLIATTCFIACDSWMQDDDFYSDIDYDVKVANAESVSVYVRYANSKMGTTDPSGYFTLKEDVPSQISAVTSDDYGFVRWAAYSTENFDPSKQHSTLFYDNAEEYAKNFAKLEIPSYEVVFSDPKNLTTDVTLETTRPDIFIMPLVAKRPAVATSVPSNGRTDVVRNSQIRVLFSKPIDPASLKDEFGNSNIQVTSGSAVLTESASDVGSKDITEFFDIKLSETKKLLTISLKKDENGNPYLMDSNSQISVIIFEDVRDTDGFTMNGKHTFQFTTGTKLDSLAPYIEILTAGTDEDCNDFQQFYNPQPGQKAQGDGTPVYTAHAEAMGNTLTSYEDVNTALPSTAKPLFAQRVKDKVNIYVKAIDIAGSGQFVDNSGEVRSESDVALLQVRASLYIDKDGNPVTTSQSAFAGGSLGTSSNTVISQIDIPYAMGMKDTDCQITRAFEDLYNDFDTDNDPSTENSPDGPKGGHGTAFTYDLSSLDDGLIKIDVWAVDMVGNDGLSDVYATSDQVWYNNGYRSIFVVKDTTAPDAASTINKNAVIPDMSGATEDNYFNRTTYQNIRINGDVNTIIDNGAASLVSKHENIKWIVKPSSDSVWTRGLTPSTPGWVSVTSNYSGFTAPSSDGPVTLKYALMDDLGNISNAVEVGSVQFDGTAPSLSVPNWKADTGSTAGIASESILTKQTLEIPVTEATSGIKKIEFTVTKDNVVSTSEPLSGSIVVGGTSIPYTPSGNTITFSSPVIGTSKITINGIKLTDDPLGENENYKVAVKVTDAANNPSTVKDTIISIDSVAPVIERLSVPGIKGTKEISSTGTVGTVTKYWINNTSTSSTIPRTYIDITFKEAGSGAKIFDFSYSTVKLTADSQLFVNYGTASQRQITSDVDTSLKTLTVKNQTDAASYLAKKNDSGNAVPVTVRITNIELASATTDSKVAVIIRDTATNVSGEYKTITSDGLELTPDSDGYSCFRYDYTTPNANSPSLVDRDSTESNSTETAATGKTAAQSGYTNDAYIDASVTLYPRTSGIASITISGDAVFDANTKLYIGSNEIFYSRSADGKTAIFQESDTDNGSAVITASSSVSLSIKDLKLTAGEGTNRVSFYPKGFGGLYNSSISSSSIVLDTTPPEWDGSGIYGIADSSYHNSVYPHSSSSNAVAGLTNVDSARTNDIYFYFNDGKPDEDSTYNLNIKAKTVETNKRSDAILFTIGSSSFTKGDEDTFYGKGFGKYTAVARDKAGNKSTVKTFYIVKDESFANDASELTAIDNYMTIEMPDSAASVFPNTTTKEHQYSDFNYLESTNVDNCPMITRDYIIKQAADPYKIKIKLASGTTSSDKQVDGKTAVPTDGNTAYNRLKATTSSAPLEYYSVSHWYKYFSNPGDGNTSFEPFSPDNIPGTKKLSWHKYQTSSSDYTDTDIKSRVDAAGNIEIEIPRTASCPPLSIFLKDACGNITWRLIRPVSFNTDEGSHTNNYSVAWIVDKEVGMDDYKGLTTLTISNAKSYSDTAFYKGTVTLNNGSRGVDDYAWSETCRYTTTNVLGGDAGNSSEYSLKSRIIASSTTPSQNDFETAVTGTNASEWYYRKQSNSETGNTSFYLENTFPRPTTRTKLFYIVQDTVGNYKIYRIDSTSNTTCKLVEGNPNTTSSSSVPYWLYDANGPTVNNFSYYKINQVADGSNTYNYYSNKSYVTYNIQDSGSGVWNAGKSETSYPGWSSISQRQSISNYQVNLSSYASLSGTTLTIPPSSIYDYAGNTTTSDLTLSNNSNNKWRYLSTAPTLATNAAKAVNTTLLAGENDNLTGNTETKTDTDTSGQELLLTAKWGVTNIKVQLYASQSGTATGDTGILGWVVKSSPITSFADFYSTSDVSSDVTWVSDSTNSYWKYEYSKGVSGLGTPWHELYPGALYFYPVNKAGLICQTPVKVKFKTNKKPTITSGSSASGYNYSDNGTIGKIDADYLKNDAPSTPHLIKVSGTGASAINYTKYGASVTFTTTEGPTKYRFVGSGTDGILLKDNTHPNAADDNTYGNWTNLTGDGPSYTINLTSVEGTALGIQLARGNEEDSDVYPLYGPSFTGHAGSNNWVYDSVTPGIAFVNNTDPIKSGSASGDAAVTFSGDETGTKYIQAANASISFVLSNNGSTDHYQWKTNTGSGWSDWTDISSSYLNITDEQLTFPAPESKTQYMFRVIDVAGNISTEMPSAGTSPVRLQRDQWAPEAAGGLTYELRNGTTKVSTEGMNIPYNNAGTVDEDTRVISYSKTSTNTSYYIDRIWIKLSNVTDKRDSSGNVSASGIERSGIKQFDVYEDGYCIATLDKDSTEYEITGLNSKQENQVYEYKIKVVDNLDQEKTLITFNTNADGQAPDLGLITGDSLVQKATDAEGAGATDWEPKTGSTYYLNSAYTIINLKKTATDVFKYQFTTNGGTSWTEFTPVVDTTGETHSVKYIFATPETATYQFRAIDGVGNASTPTDAITIQKDTTAPTNTVTWSFKKDDGADAIGNDFYNITVDGTAIKSITYNGNKMNKFEFNVSSIASASDTSGIRRYWLKIGDAEKIDSLTAASPAFSTSTNTWAPGIATTGSEEVSYQIWAEDWAGNTTDVKEFKLTNDVEAPAISFADSDIVQTKAGDETAVNAISIGEDSNKVYYLNKAKAVINLGSSSTDNKKYLVSVDGGEYSPITSESGLSTSPLSYTFAAPTTPTTYSFKVIDNVGNESSATGTVKLVQDITAPALKEGVPVPTFAVLNASDSDATPVSDTVPVADYIVSKSGTTVTITYNPNVVKTISFNNLSTELNEYATSGANSGFARLYYKSATGDPHDMDSDNNGTNVISLGDAWNNKTYSVYATDKAGNQSATLITLKLTADKTGPELDSSKVSEENGFSGIKMIHSYSARKPKAEGSGYDNTSISNVIVEEIGGKKKANLCTDGTQIMYAKTLIPDAVKYQIVITTTTGVDENSKPNGFDATPASDGWHDMDDGTTDNTGTNYIFTLPEVHAHHKRLALFFLDSLGNKSAPYYIGNMASNDFGIQWWLTTPELSASNITISNVTLLNDSTKVGWQGVTKDYLVSIKLPKNAVVHSLELAPPKGNNNTGVVYAEGVNKDVKDQIAFTGYTATNNAVTELKTACINLAESDAVGLNLKIYVWDKNKDGGAISWSDPKIKINGIECQIFPAESGGFANIRTTASGSFKPAGINTASPVAAKSDDSEKTSRVTQFFNNVSSFFISESEPEMAQTSPAAEKTAKDSKVSKKAAKKAKTSKKKAQKQSVEIADQPISVITEQPAAELVVNEITGVTEKLNSEAQALSTGSITAEVSSTTAEADSVAAETSLTAPEAAEKKTPSKSASIVIMLAILSSFSAVWYLQRNRKK